MNTDICNHLITLNRQFYQTFAGQFSATRMRLQPGVQRVLADMPVEINILDLGCGNGELWRTLARSGHSGRYTGVDFSAELLEIAENTPPDEGHPCRPESLPRPSFIQADITGGDWASGIPEPPYKTIFAFAALHHIPGHANRVEILRRVRGLMLPEGAFIHSEWQFLNSPRLRARIQPWDKVGLSAESIEAGDYLLDWRRGGYGLRYVHHFEPDELEHLAEASGFRIYETFTSDGENGQLGLYQVWVPNER